MPLSNLPEFPCRQVVVLAVSPDESDQAALRRIFTHSNWTIRTARDGREAVEHCRAGQVPVVLCARHLPDGDWKDLLQAFEAESHPPRLVVTSRHADDLLWAEVLNLGGYDVLPIPFDALEVFRVISLAWRHWVEETSHHPAPRPREAAMVA
ncbi:MAG: response regulator [Candidatus Solibacter usitatus]|nr:response regulator [Candidatus Solibacter usitatus]